MESRIAELSAQNTDLHQWRSRAQHLSIELEELKRKKEYESKGQQDRIEDRDGDEVYRKEIARESLS
jgi:hypothetical protein